MLKDPCYVLKNCKLKRDALVDFFQIHMCEFYFPLRIFQLYIFYWTYYRDKFQSIIHNFSIISIILLIIGTISIIHVNKRWFQNRYIKFWSGLLWFPIFLLYIYLLAFIIPELHPEDKLSPGSGLLILFGMVLHSFYIIIINALFLPNYE